MSGSAARLKYAYDQIKNQSNKETKPMKLKIEINITECEPEQARIINVVYDNTNPKHVDDILKYLIVRPDCKEVSINMPYSKPKPLSELETFYETFQPFCDKYGIKLRGLQPQMAEHIMIYRSKGQTYDEQFPRQYGKTFLGLVLCAWFAETFPELEVLINRSNRFHAIGTIEKLKALGITPQPKNLYIYSYDTTNKNYELLTRAGRGGMVFNDDADESGKCQLTNKTFCLSSPMNPLHKLK